MQNVNIHYRNTARQFHSYCVSFTQTVTATITSDKRHLIKVNIQTLLPPLFSASASTRVATTKLDGSNVLLFLVFLEAFQTLLYL